MKAKRMPNFERGLVKACRMDLGMEVRDYYGVHIAQDMRDSHLKPFRRFIEANAEDSVFIISFKWKSKEHRIRAERAWKKLAKKQK